MKQKIKVMTKVETLKQQNKLLSLSIIDALAIVLPKSKYVEMAVNMIKNHERYLRHVDNEQRESICDFLIKEYNTPKEDLDKLTNKEISQIWSILDNVPYDVRSALKSFIPLNERGLIDNKDITSYKDVQEVLKQIALAEFKAINKELEKQIHKVYEDDNWLVLRPLSRESSMKYGAGTKWCTAAESDDYQYWNYTGRGILIYTINKKTGQKVATFKNLSKDHDHELSFWNEIDTRIDSYETNLPQDIINHIFKELKSDKTNRVMSPEKDARFEKEKLSYDGALIAGGQLHFTEANNSITINNTVSTLQEPEMTREEIDRADEEMYMTEEPSGMRQELLESMKIDALIELGPEQFNRIEERVYEYTR
jgi:hypothetical protein